MTAEQIFTYFSIVLISLFVGYKAGIHIQSERESDNQARERFKDVTHELNKERILGGVEVDEEPQLQTRPIGKPKIVLRH